jgi:predicted RNA binding protein YcfA (HicA-like mRNA interferase family)
VGKLPGVPHQRAVHALEKAGFRVVPEGKHVVMSDGVRILTIPRHDPVNAFTMAGIVRDAGLSEEEFRGLLELGPSPPMFATMNMRNPAYLARGDAWPG